MGERMNPGEELDRLRQREQDLADRVSEVDAEQRAAGEAVQVASAAVVDLETRAGLGEKVSEQDRAKAEDALLQARSKASAPWPERRQAALQAAAEGRRQTASHVEAHLDTLLDGLAEQGTQAAEAIDQAAETLLARIADRARVEQQVFGLLQLVGSPRPGDVARSRCERLAAEAGKLLEQGGELPPVATVRPGEARFATIQASA
jgi:hypothetical protein